MKEINRRAFLQTAVIGGASLFVPNLIGCSDESHSKPRQPNLEKYLLQGREKEGWTLNEEKSAWYKEATKDEDPLTYTTHSLVKFYERQMFRTTAELRMHIYKLQSNITSEGIAYLKNSLSRFLSVGFTFPEDIIVGINIDNINGGEIVGDFIPLMYAYSKRLHGEPFSDKYEHPFANKESFTEYTNWLKKVSSNPLMKE